MKVLISGATGLIGSALAQSCGRDGWQVSVLARNASRAAAAAPHAILHPWDATKGPPPESAFEGADVVVNLMGESIAGGRWSDARKKLLRDSRIVGTRAQVDTMRGLARRPRLFI
jgi:NAD dependent epimerase/dehydratase family enzyme